MEVFEHPNMQDFKCPICGTNANRPVALVPIDGTEEGGKCKAEQIHLECIDLVKVLINDKNRLISESF
jgi:hypothetical protein